MAGGEFVAIDIYAQIAGQELQDHMRSLNFGVTRAALDGTTFTHSFMRYFMGLKDTTLSSKFNADYAADEADDLLFDPWNDGTAVDVNIRPDNDTIATDNPEYQLSQFVENFGILNVTPGQIAENDVTFKNASGDMVRAVAP